MLFILSDLNSVNCFHIGKPRSDSAAKSVRMRPAQPSPVSSDLTTNKKTSMSEGTLDVLILIDKRCSKFI